MGEETVTHRWRNCHPWMKKQSLMGEETVTHGWRNSHSWVKKQSPMD